VSPFDSTVFTDVAATLGIASPSIPEKDYYAIQLLKCLQKLNITGFAFVFSGGTCLSRVYKNTYRMSEDIDIKMVNKQEGISRNEAKKSRKVVRDTVREIITESDLFNIVDSKCRNEYKYQQFIVEYPKTYADVDALRPELQLEITESSPLEDPTLRPVGSLYSEVATLPSEITSFLCVTESSIASEKFISLLRRTAAFTRDNSLPDDETLIRHVYDLHIMRDILLDLDRMSGLVDSVIAIDSAQFSAKHKEFAKDPKSELLFALRTLKENPAYKERYKKFLGPLVYNPTYIEWETALSTVENFANSIL
jgi:predicted nucleotidyltransferase component of viral defense system